MDTRTITVDVVKLLDKWLSELIELCSNDAVKYVPEDIDDIFAIYDHKLETLYEVGLIDAEERGRIGNYMVMKVDECIKEDGDE